MRIDVHTHIFPEKIVQQREIYFEGESAFKSLYGSPKARLATAETLLQAMDAGAVDCSITFGFPWRNPDLTERHNDYVLEAALKCPSRLLAMGCVNPMADKSAEEAERVLRAGACGLGELAVYDACEAGAALERYRDLIDCCRSHQGILLIHANEPVGHLYPGKSQLGLDFYYALARLAEGMTLILAHWGGGLCFYELLKKEASEVLANVHYDTAASPFLYRPTIYAHMTEVVGAKKILFGSDYPLLTATRYFEEMAASGLTAEQLDAIGGGNAARLFGLLSVAS